MRFDVLEPNTLLIEEGTKAKDFIYIVLSGKIDARRHLNAKKDFRALAKNTHTRNRVNDRVNALNGQFGDLVSERIFTYEDRSRPLVGWESHTIFSDGGSPFTFITSHHQEQNEGKVFVLKITPKVLLHDLKLNNETMNKINLKQQTFIDQVTSKKRIIENGYTKIFS
mmetsp:Transcript_12975/g.20098  ORF Transcript_12975/g.20098 Transcript_12975/m.20098 type:complete len:168 (-) Transcript_12975:1384-1887(-)